jgi:hypothetical protein
MSDSRVQKKRKLDEQGDGEKEAKTEAGNGSVLGGSLPVSSKKRAKRQQGSRTQQQQAQQQQQQQAGAQEGGSASGGAAQGATSMAGAESDAEWNEGYRRSGGVGRYVPPSRGKHQDLLFDDNCIEEESAESGDNFVASDASGEEEQSSSAESNRSKGKRKRGEKSEGRDGAAEVVGASGGSTSRQAETQRRQWGNPFYTPSVRRPNRGNQSGDSAASPRLEGFMSLRDPTRFVHAILAISGGGRELFKAMLVGALEQQLLLRDSAAARAGRRGSPASNRSKATGGESLASMACPPGQRGRSSSAHCSPDCSTTAAPCSENTARHRAQLIGALQHHRILLLAIQAGVVQSAGRPPRPRPVEVAAP